MTKKEYIYQVGLKTLRQGVEVGLVPAASLRRAEIVLCVDSYQKQGHSRMDSIAFAAVDFGVTERAIQYAIQ